MHTCSSVVQTVADPRLVRSSAAICQENMPFLAVKENS